ncbi:hypothetical protein M5K25_023987 [Dendrobium thyrsiflorum]|uniref:Uncharacterized protein n=1 Tax=Dendrobium thyrsiflorum TaxID=117978 RepID=A0ABD0U0S0_DENTH
MENYRNVMGTLDHGKYIRDVADDLWPRSHQSIFKSSYLKEKFHKPVFPQWMADPKVNHGFVYNEQGSIDILRSPFFDFTPGVDDSVEEYVERIVFTLSGSIEEQICNVQWQITSKPKQGRDGEMESSGEGSGRGEMMELCCSLCRWLRSLTLARAFSGFAVQCAQNIANRTARL